MSTISISTPSDGETIDAADISTPLNTIVADYNGNIDNSNIAAAAAIAGTKLANNAVTNAKINDVSAIKITNPYKFSIFRTSALNSANTPTAVAHDTKTFDTGTNVDVVTNKGRFTAPVAGFYFFSAVAGNTTATATRIASFLYKNGSAVKTGSSVIPASVAVGTFSTVSGLIQLAANDYVEHYFIGGSGSAMNVGSLDVCYFDGFLVSTT